MIGEKMKEGLDSLNLEKTIKVFFFPFHVFGIEGVFLFCHPFLTSLPPQIIIIIIITGTRQ